MSAQIGFGVRLYGYHFEDDQLPVNLAAGIVKADEGKALTIDTSADNKMKLAADGEAIRGYLVTVENRTQEGVLLGTCAFEFAQLLPIKSGLSGADVVARGKLLLGAGSGQVKGMADDASDRPMCFGVVTKSGVDYAVAVYT